MASFTLGKGINGVNWAGYSYAQANWDDGNRTYFPNPYETGRPAFATQVPDRYIDHLVAYSIKVARVPVDPTPMFIASSDAALDAQIDIALGPVAKFTSKGIKVVLDMHVNFYPGVADTGFDAVGVLNDGARFQRMLYVYKRIALKLVQRFTAAKVAFEPFNEPPPPDRVVNWAGVSAPAIFRAVRAVSPNLTVVMTGDTWANSEGMVKLKASDFDANTVFTFHCYENNIVSHQSVNPDYMAPWDGVSYMSRVPFPPDPAKKAAFIATAKRNIDSDIWKKISGNASEIARLKSQVDRLANDYFDTPYGRDHIKKHFTRVAAWCVANSVTSDRILLGETGIWGDVGGKQGADNTARANYLGTMKSLCEEFGYSVTYWELCGTDNTAWWLTSTYGAKDIDPAFAPLFAAPASPVVPTPAPVPTPTPPVPLPVNSLLSSGKYVVPNGSTLSNSNGAVVLTVP